MRTWSAHCEADTGAERTAVGARVHSPGPLLVEVNTPAPGRNFEGHGLFYLSPCTSAERRQR